MTLCVLETHPIQYHAPVWRALVRNFGVDVTAIYGSDFSVRGYRDAEFGVSFAWGSDLLSGYRSVFLSEGGDAQQPLEEALESVAPSAVLCVGYAKAFHLRALRAAHRLGVPILFRAETSDVARPHSGPRALARDGVLRGLYARCEALLYIGKASRAHYERLGAPPEKLFFSPYCVDEAVFSAGEKDRAGLRHTAREQLGITDDRFVALFSGKLSPRKGPDLLLRAIAAMPRENRPTAVFLGAGELESELRGIAATLRVEARFTGFRNQKDLSPVFHAADCLVLPSRHGETWGLVVNEALLHGIPVVVSEAVGCHPDLVEEGVTGTVTRTGDEVALAEGLGRVRDRLHGEKTRAACRSRAAAYSTERAAAGIAQALAHVGAGCASST